MIKKLALSTLVIGTGLVGLVSCGNTDRNSSKAIDQLQQQETQGVYRATFSPINSAVAGETTGSLTLKIQGDEVEVNIAVEGAPAYVVHMQNIRIGAKCPEATSDINKDGFIDISEAESVSGGVMIPLDSDINSQLAGSNYPVARSTGRYLYSEAASLTSLIADLYSPVEGLDDSFTKLEAGQELNLSGRVVMIHGVAGLTALPDTVKTKGTKEAQATIPIACGVLSRVIGADPVSTSNGGKD